jgi:hypothetical protein
VHHLRRSLIVLLLLAIAASGCSKGDDGAERASTSSTAPTGSILPGGSVPSTEPGQTTTTDSSGDPSEGIPRDQFCRGFAEVRGSETAMADAVTAGDVTSFQAAFNRLTDAYLAMADNPPDEIYDEVRAVAFLYDDLTAKVNAAPSTDDLKALALQFQSGRPADDLEALRDYGSASC